jgi:hypothetical protein
VEEIDPETFFGQSNIYFQPDELGDGSVGSLTFIEEGATAEQSGYQGLYFRWGSLIGVSPTGSDFDADTYLYIPDLVSVASYGKYYKVKASDVTDSYANGSNSDMQIAVRALQTSIGSDLGADWNLIPHVKDGSDPDQIDASEAGRDDYRLTTRSTDSGLYPKYKGDICKFLSDKKVTNGSDLKKNWVMPVSNAFGSEEDYTKSISWDDMVTSSSSAPENGTSVILDTYYTYKTATDEKVVFPAAGYRNDGALDLVGIKGYYWSSSVDYGAYTYNLSFASGYVNPDDGFNYRAYGFPVRCIQEKVK